MNLKDTELYYKKYKKIPRTVLKTISKNETIYGARALNMQLAKKYRAKTLDYDVFTKTPKQSALRTEKALDKLYNKNYFETKPALHEGTYRVSSNINGDNFADYTIPNEKIQTKKINGKSVATIDWFKKHIKATLKDKTAVYRHLKDRDVLNRILLSEKLLKKKKVKRHVSKRRTCKKRR